MQMNKTLKINPAFFFSILIGYFSVSLALFFVFWIKWFISTPLVLGLMFVNIYLIRSFFNFFECDLIKLKTLLLLFIITLFSLFLVGIGGVFEQKYDLYNRTIISSQLVFFDQPLVDPLNSKLYFSYYIGYFIIPAFVTKLLGFEFFLIVDFITNTFLLFSILILFYFRGKNFGFIIYLLPSGIYWLLERYVFAINSGFRYFNFLNVLAHGPQQIFPSLFGLIYLITLPKEIIQKSIIFVFGILFFWSPFSVLGIGIIYLWDGIHLSLKSINFTNVFGFICIILLVLFFSGKQSSIEFYIVNIMIFTM